MDSDLKPYLYDVFPASTCEDGCTYLRERMHVLAPWRSVLTGKPCVVDGLTEIGDCKAAADGGHHLEQDADEGGGLGYVDGESRRLLHHGHYCTPHLCRGLAGLQPADVAAEHLLIFNIYRKTLRGVGRLPGLFFFLPHKGAAIEVLDGLGGIGQDLVSATIDIDDYLSFFIFHLKDVLLWSYPGVIAAETACEGPAGVYIFAVQSKGNQPLSGAADCLRKYQVPYRRWARE